MESAGSLPVVDFSPFITDEGCLVGAAPTAGQLAVAAQIDRAMRAHGFLYLEHLGVDEALLASAFDAARATFALTDATKASEFSPYDLATNTGYSRKGAQSANRARPADLRETFAVNFRHIVRNDFRGTPAAFAPTAEALWDRCEDASRRFAVACALALGLPSEELDFFASGFKRNENSALVFSHYPPCDFELGVSDGASAGGSIRVGEHADFGLFTFLFLEGTTPGLQVRKAAEGEGGGLAAHKATPGDTWTDAHGRGGASAIVNAGAMLARWTNDLWRATTHRVVVQSAEEAAEHRYSMPFFAQADTGTHVVAHPLFVPKGEAPRYAAILADVFLRLKLAELSGAKL